MHKNQVFYSAGGESMFPAVRGALSLSRLILSCPLTPALSIQQPWLLLLRGAADFPARQEGVTTALRTLWELGIWYFSKLLKHFN